MPIEQRIARKAVIKTVCGMDAAVQPTGMYCDACSIRKDLGQIQLRPRRDSQQNNIVLAKNIRTPVFAFVQEVAIQCLISRMTQPNFQRHYYYSRVRIKGIGLEHFRIELGSSNPAIARAFFRGLPALRDTC